MLRTTGTLTVADVFIEAGIVTMCQRLSDTFTVDQIQHVL